MRRIKMNVRDPKDKEIKQLDNNVIFYLDKVKKSNSAKMNNSNASSGFVRASESGKGLKTYNLENI